MPFGIVFALTACDNSPPLSEGILGDWEVWCRTDQESESGCLGKEDSGLTKRFHPDGTVEIGARTGAPTRGQWTLAGSELVLTFEGGGMRLVEEYRARIEDDRLILWSSSFGTVHGRAGATLVPSPSPSSSGRPVTQQIGSLRYTLTVPPGHRLARDDNDRQRWEPASGAGFVVDLTLSPRAQTQIDGQWVTPPCNDYDYGGVSSAGGTIDGVERDTSIGTSLCVPQTELVLMCSTGHTRGWLELSEKEAALALCKSLSLQG